MQKATVAPGVAWNRGMLRGQKPPLKPQEIWAIRVRLQLGRRIRDLALFNRDRQRRANLSTRQYARIVRRWVASIGLEPSSYGTHTMRRTKATLIYRRTRNIRAVQLLLGHTKLESTVRYLGIEVDDALEISEQTDA